MSGSPQNPEESATESCSPGPSFTFPSSKSTPIFTFEGKAEDIAEAPVFNFAESKSDDQEPPSDTFENLSKLNEIHVFTLPSQGNIFTLAELPRKAKGSLILVASLAKPVNSLRFDPDPSSEALMAPVYPSREEINFTYIPSGADIAALDSFRRYATNHDYVIGNYFH